MNGFSAFHISYSFFLYLLFSSKRNTVQFFLGHFLVYRLCLIKVIIDCIVEGHKIL